MLARHPYDVHRSTCLDGKVLGKDTSASQNGTAECAKRAVQRALRRLSWRTDLDGGLSDTDKAKGPQIGSDGPRPWSKSAPRAYGRQINICTSPPSHRGRLLCEVKPAGIREKKGSERGSLTKKGAGGSWRLSTRLIAPEIAGKPN